MSHQGHQNGCKQACLQRDNICDSSALLTGQRSIAFVGACVEGWRCKPPSICQEPAGHEGHYQARVICEGNQIQQVRQVQKPPETKLSASSGRILLAAGDYHVMQVREPKSVQDERGLVKVGKQWAAVECGS